MYSEDLVDSAVDFVDSADIVDFENFADSVAIQVASGANLAHKGSIQVGEADIRVVLGTHQAGTLPVAAISTDC